MSWIENLDLDRAIKAVQQDARSADFCLDPLRFQDLSKKTVKKELKSLILKKLKKSYQASKLLTIDVPKPNYILRPAGHPNLIDWIIYQAVVDYILSRVYEKIPPNSYSFKRFKDKQIKKEKFKSVDYWKEFEKDAFTFSRDENYSSLLKSDVTSYFENICLDVLEERLRILSPTNKDDYSHAVSLLIKNILKAWTSEHKIHGFSLPQGPTASSILADIYLYSVDKELNKQNGVKFIRYMDDIRLFAPDKSHLKLTMKVLVKSLRDLRLNLNDKKTSVYNLGDRERLKEVFDPERSRLDLIDNAFRAEDLGQIKLAAPSLFELLDIYKSEKSIFGERYFRFFIGKIIDLMKYKCLKEDCLISLANDFLLMFEDKHHHAKILNWFFTASAQYSNEAKKLIKNGLIEFICDKKKNLYEWQEMWALDVIRQLGITEKSDLDKIKNKYAKHNDLCYMQFALIAGSYGDHDELEEILTDARCENDQYRATLLSLKKLDKNIIERADLKVHEYFKTYVNELNQNDKYGFFFVLDHKKLRTEEYEEYDDEHEDYEEDSYY